MEPQHAIIGDGTGVDLPQAQPDPNTLVEEKKMAKYSRSAEYGRLKEHLEARIAFYQLYLPGSESKEIQQLNREERADKWAIADDVIKEIRAIIDTYDQIASVVKENA